MITIELIKRITAVDATVDANYEMVVGVGPLLLLLLLVFRMVEVAAVAPAARNSSTDQCS